MTDAYSPFDPDERSSAGTPPPVRSELFDQETDVHRYLAGPEFHEQGDEAAQWFSRAADSPLVDSRGYPNWEGLQLEPAGRYEVTRRIGRGGMGVVYEAADNTRHGARVAVKVPFAALLCSPMLQERFDREFRALVELEHPHICRVLDTGRHQAVPYLVLQYLGGGNLRQKYLDSPPHQFPRTKDNLIAWLEPVAKALDFVHSRGFVHRDVKPENILFDEHGAVYLGDFGIVRAVQSMRQDHDVSLTQVESPVGTPGYIAPEIQAGQPADGKADQFALASVAYIYLHGKLPAVGDAVNFTQAGAQGSVPTQAQQVLYRAMSANPDERFPTCAAFAEALRDACAVVVALAPGDAPPALERRQTRPWIVAAMLLGLLTTGWTWREQLQAMLTPGAQQLPNSPPGPGPPGDSESPPPPSIHDQPNPSPVVPGDLVDEAERHGLAQYFLSSSRFTEALEEAESQLGTQPDQIELLAIKAQSLTKLKRYAEADACWDRVVELEATPEHLALRGYCRLEAGDLHGALRDVDEAIGRDASIAFIRGYRGWILLSLDRYDEAITEFTQAIQLGGAEATATDRAFWHHGRGAAHAHGGNLPESLSDATEAIRFEPTTPKHYRNRAAVLEQLQRHEEARRDRQQAEAVYRSFDG